MLAAILFAGKMNAQETDARQTDNDLYAALGTIPAADDTVYVFIDDEPDARIYLPAPPDTSSMEFMDDLLQFQWGKTQRNTPRGAQASRESLWTVEMMRVLMAEVLNIDTISDTETPALARLLVKSFNTGKQSTHSAKTNGWRTRPFVQMNDAIWAQYDDDNLRNNSSYPSGHSALGWYTALTFAEMWPELQDTILRRGFQFGENRVIVGAHYQSDVNAGYLCAAAAFARSHIKRLSIWLQPSHCGISLGYGYRSYPSAVDRTPGTTECRPRFQGVSGECPCRILEDHRTRHFRGGSCSHSGIRFPCLSAGWYARHEPHARHRHSKWAEDS